MGRASFAQGVVVRVIQNTSVVAIREIASGSEAVERKAADLKKKDNGWPNSKANSVKINFFTILIVVTLPLFKIEMRVINHVQLLCSINHCKI